MKSKKIIIAAGVLCLYLLVGVMPVVFAATPSNATTQNVTNMISSRQNEYKKVGITLDGSGHFIYKNKVVRHLVEETSINDTSKVSYQYLNENGVVDLIITRLSINSDGSASSFGGNLEVSVCSQEEFTRKNIEQIKILIDSTTSQSAVDWSFNDNPVDNKGDGNFANKISDQDAIDWSFNDNPADNKGDGNFANKIDDVSDAKTIDKRIKEYQKLGLEVKYSNVVSQDNPLKLMYADVFYDGKQVKEITDGDSFKVTFINAPTTALALKAAYNSKGVLSGFNEIK